MKNLDRLFDAIGEVDEKFIPDHSEKRRITAKHRLIAAACAAAVVAGAIWIPADGGIVNQSGEAMVLAAAEYPEMEKSPEFEDYPDYQSYNEALQKWKTSRNQFLSKPAGYADGYQLFFQETTAAFLADTGKNAVYSPLGLYIALGMTAEITAGETQQQILELMGEEDISSLRPDVRALWLTNYIEDEKSKCVLGSSVWLRGGFPYHQNTVENLANNYYSSVYSGNPASGDYSRMFQEWLSHQTDGLLDNYISHIKLDPDMMLTLASTISYSGRWTNQFQEQKTSPGIFHGVSGDIQKDFMNAELMENYCWGEDFSSVSLRLGDNGFMRFLLPEEGVTPAQLLGEEEVLEFMYHTSGYADCKFVEVNLSVPKFDVSSSADLREGLTSLGITDVFEPETADFSPLTDSHGDVYLSSVQQANRVIIDEEGCKAASYTIEMALGGALPDERVDFILDRPFIFELVSASGTPLFVGIVNE